MTDQFGRSEAISIRDRLMAEHARYLTLVSLIPISEARLQEDSRRYLCLRCAGFLEQMVFLTVRHYLGKKTSGPALAFSTSFFLNAPNLSPTALGRVFGRFGQADSDRLATFLNGSRRKTLDDLMAIRNPVAHGQDVVGAKLDPTQYLEFCDDFYQWCVANYMGD